MIETNYELQGSTYTIQEDDTGLVVGTDYYDSADEKRGREFFNWSSKWGRVRVFISKPSQFDTINIIGTPHRCLITLGHNPFATPPGAWTEFVCENGEPDWTGYLLGPEHNWQGSLAIDEMAAGEFTVEFYGHLRNIDPKTGVPRRGRGMKSRIVRKIWQCPGRFGTAVQVPHITATPGFPRLRDFDRHWDAAAPKPFSAPAAIRQPAEHAK